MTNARLALIATTFLLCQASQCQSACDRLTKHDPQASVDYLQVAPVAMTVLQQAAQTKPDNSCIETALFVLGQTHEPDVVPVLVKWLSWENTSRFKYRVETPGKKYPAISALQDVGEPAIPALLETVRKTDPQSLFARNALQAFMAINRTDPASGIKRLKAEARVRKGSEQQHLIEASNNAKAIWCRGRTDCD